MENDQLSEKSFSSLNTLNLRTHTTKDKFSVNKDDTVRFYLSTLRGDYDTSSAPDLLPLLEDPPKQPTKAAAAKRKSGKRRKNNKENLRPPSSPAAPPREGAAASAGDSQEPAVAAVDSSPAAEQKPGEDENCGGDPLRWFRSRSKPTVEEEFEAFKQRFVWNGSRLTTSAVSSRARRASGEDSGVGGAADSDRRPGAVSGPGASAVAIARDSAALAAVPSTRSDELSPASTETNGATRDPSVASTAAGPPAPAEQLQLAIPNKPAMARRLPTRRAVSDALGAPPPPPPQPPPLPPSPPVVPAAAPPHALVSRLQPAGISDASPISRTSVDQGVQTTPEVFSRTASYELSSTGGEATQQSDSPAKLERPRRGPHQWQRLSEEAKDKRQQPLPLRLPPLDAVDAAATLSRGGRGQAIADSAMAGRVDGADDDDRGSVIAPVDRSKLVAIKSRMHSRVLHAGAGSSSAAGENEEEEEGEEAEEESVTNLVSAKVPLTAKIETIKLLAREKRKQQQQMKKRQRAAAAAAVPPQPQQPALWHELDGAGALHKRRDALPPLPGRQSVEVSSLRRTTPDFGETESRACVSEVHPGRVHNLSMNFDAYIRAMERMVDATLKTLSQAELY